MKRELEKLFKKEVVEEKSKEEYFRKEPVPSLIRKYLAEKCEKEKEPYKPT